MRWRNFFRGIIAAGLWFGMLSSGSALAATTANVAPSNCIQIDAHALNNAFLALKKNPNDRLMQAKFLLMFPNNVQTFRYIYFADLKHIGELSDVTMFHLQMLSKLSDQYPYIVGNILVSISKDGLLTSDAFTWLKIAMLGYAESDPVIFGRLYDELTNDEKKHIVVFMADWENFKDMKLYQDVIDNLNKNGESQLAIEFENARAKRMHTH